MNQQPPPRPRPPLPVYGSRRSHRSPHRLRTHDEYTDVYAEGDKLIARYLIAFARRRSEGQLNVKAPIGRLGININVKDPGVRERIKPRICECKRLISEWMRQHDWVPSGWDLVIATKNSIWQRDDFDINDFIPDLSKILSQLHGLEAERSSDVSPAVDDDALQTVARYESPYWGTWGASPASP